MKYGLPYKGSKNKLAKRIVDILPQRAHLYDLFCGGCAVTHAAMMGKKFEDFHINDINWMCPTFFKDVLEGKYNNDIRWISREDFQRLKDTDPYVAFVWSFGNNMETYMYGDVEPLKKAIHYAIFFDDLSFAEELGLDFSFVKGITDERKKYLKIKHFFENNGGVFMLEHFCRGRRLSEMFGKRKELGNYKTTSSRIASYPLGKALSPTNMGGGENCLTTSVGDYQDVKIKPNSVIYCDIPYKSTYGYVKDNGFDYERFYDWACSQQEPIFISEYWMPEDEFECVAEFAHRSTYSHTKNSLVAEKLFIPKGQKEKGYIQLNLFL